jgi:hypothetical protein
MKDGLFAILVAVLILVFVIFCSYIIVWAFP